MNVYINFISENYIYSQKYSNYSISEFFEQNVEKIATEILSSENIEFIIINLYPYQITNVYSIKKYTQKDYSIYNFSITYSDDYINNPNNVKINNKLLCLFVKKKIEQNRRIYEAELKKFKLENGNSDDILREIIPKLNFFYKMKVNGTISLFDELYIKKSKDLDKKLILNEFNRLITKPSYNKLDHDISEISTIVILTALQNSNLSDKISLDVSTVLNFLEERTERNIPIDIKSYKNVLNKIIEMSFSEFIISLSKSTRNIKIKVLKLLTEINKLKLY